LCIVMELAHSNLTQLIKTGPLELKLLIKIALGIVRGINFLHTSKPKIIHRDLKPDNILVHIFLNNLIFSSFIRKYY
jgi:serine/threonine protein kinase